MVVFSLKMISFQLFLKFRIDCTRTTIFTIITMRKNPLVSIFIHIRKKISRYQTLREFRFHFQNKKENKK